MIYVHGRADDYHVLFNRTNITHAHSPFDGEWSERSAMKLDARVRLGRTGSGRSRRWSGSRSSFSTVVLLVTAAILLFLYLTGRLAF
jgi:hypothetical protein